MAQNTLSPLEESLDNRLKFSSNIEQLTSDFLRSKKYLVINGFLFEKLLIDKGLDPNTCHESDTSVQKTIAEILKEQLFKDCPTFNALETTHALAQYLHQGNLLYVIPSIAQDQLNPVNLRLNIEKSKKHEQVCDQIWINHDEKSRPEQPIFTLKQTSVIRTGITDRFDTEELITNSKKNAYLLYGRCEHRVKLTNHNGDLKVTTQLESLKITSPNQELDAFLNRTAENNESVTRTFAEYIESCRGDPRHGHTP
jgi:hypothetical protein